MTQTTTISNDRRNFFKVFIGTFRLMHFLPVITMTTIAIVVTMLSIKGSNTFLQMFNEIKDGTIAILPIILLILTVFFQEAFCGIQNDYIDREIDALYKKSKAIVDNWVSPKYALWLSIIFFLAFSGFSFAVGYFAHIGFWSVLYVQIANLIGMFYNFYAKHKPISILPYLLGFPLLPGYVWLTFGGFELRYLWIIPILVLVSFPAHIANEIPDYELDKEYNNKNFAVYVGKKIATILYWLSILLIEAVLVIVYFMYNLNLWIMLSITISSLIVGSIALYLLWKNKWHTNLLIFNLVTVCIGIEVIGFFILLAV